MHSIILQFYTVLLSTLRPKPWLHHISKTDHKTHSMKASVSCKIKLQNHQRGNNGQVNAWVTFNIEMVYNSFSLKDHKTAL